MSTDKPKIRKLGTIDSGLAETTPIVFRSRLYRFEYVNEKFYAPNTTGDSYFRFVDHESGEASRAFFRSGRTILSPHNPVLRASDKDSGRAIINYAWGNQRGIEHLAEAVFDGTESEFLRGLFPG